MGDTWAWYDSNQMSTITKDGSDLVSDWADVLESGHDLEQSTGTNQPEWTSGGVDFDGVDNYMQTATATLVQPVQVYLVFTLNGSWVQDATILDGYTNVTGTLYERFNVDYRLSMYAGTDNVDNTDYVITETSIIRALYYGASSELITDEHTTATGNPGTDAWAGFTLGGRGTFDAQYCSDITVKEVIIRTVADSAGDEAAIYAYLKTKHSL